MILRKRKKEKKMVQAFCYVSFRIIYTYFRQNGEFIQFAWIGLLPFELGLLLQQSNNYVQDF